MTGVQCVYLGIQPDFNNIKSQSVRAAAVTGVCVCTWESSLISITLKVSLWRAAAVTGVQCVYLGIQSDFNNIKSQSVRAAAVAGVCVCTWESSLISITLKVSL